MRTTAIWLATGALALSAATLAAAAPPPSTTNPFEGVYYGSVAGTSLVWTITVSPSGAVSGAGGALFYGAYGSGNLTGSLSSSGRLSAKGKQSIYYPPGSDCYGSCLGWTQTTRFSVRADGVPDAEGDLTFTTPQGETFFWTKQ